MREFDLLQHVFASNAELGDRVIIPPGDDMGMIELSGRRLLAAVDQLVDRRHVLVDRVPLHLVGRKAITRSLSDVAAMATRPVASLAACVLPPDFGESRARQLFDAMRLTAAEFSCPLIGGDIATHAETDEPMVCSVTVLSEPIDAEHPPVERNGAQAGDGVFVTGRLGGAYDEDGGGHHLTFSPRIKEAIELSRQLGSRLHAMIDLSDGLGRDVGHIAELSSVRIEMSAESIPCRSGFEWQQAAAMGEDYELCFTASGNVPNEILGLQVTRVGTVLTEPLRSSTPSVVIRAGHRAWDASQLGWEHGLK